MQPTSDSNVDLQPDLSEIAAGRDREELQGTVPALFTDDERRIAFEKAFDYRGDVTLTLRDTAAGKSFEAWVKKYREKKAAGEQNIAITPEALD